MASPKAITKAAPEAAPKKAAPKSKGKFVGPDSLGILLRIGEVEQHHPDKKSQIYQSITEGEFPPALVLGPKCSVWPLSEVQQVVAARARGASKAELKALVTKLVAERGLPDFQPNPKGKE